MSYCDSAGTQLHPDELAPALDPEDALAVARVIAHDDSIQEDERMRLVWAVLDAARFGFAAGDQ